MRGDEDPSHLGLITGHAYSILRLVKAKDGHKFVQVLNCQKSQISDRCNGLVVVCGGGKSILIDPDQFRRQ